MKLKIFKLALVAAAFIAAPRATAFSLLTPFPDWQVTGIGYNLPGDIGGVGTINDGFRWNVPVITYAVDASWVKYFGPRGVKAVDEAVAYFNDLPAANKITPDLSDYSTLTLREHSEALALGIIDVKSTVMSVLMEEIGFTDARRYVFTLRSRTTETVGGVTITNYVTIMRNYDPVTFAPSRYVNGVLYSYDNEEFQNPNYADAVELPIFIPDAVEAVPVAGFNAVFPGIYRVGLSRDDVGGIRFLYHPNNLAVETLLPTITGGLGGVGGAWVPAASITNLTAVTNVVVGTNGLGTNGIVNAGIRGGRNRLHFKRVFFDSILGSTFTPITNSYTDVLISTNQTLVVQAVQRGITQPDILFVSEDLGTVQGIPVLVGRSDTTTWVDNDLLNGNDEAVHSRGPGVIAPPVRISFSDQLPFFETTTDSAFVPGEDSAISSGVWGSFDGSTNPPVIYPTNQLINIQQLRRQILQGGIRR
jgi:hypothetical protein